LFNLKKKKMGLLGKKEDGSKKSFKETKIGIFLKEKAPDLLDKIGDFLPDNGGLGIIKNIISKDDTLSPKDKAEALDLLNHELEMYKIDASDRSSARAREVEYVKIGKVDWMMIATGITALLAFIFIVITAVYKPEVFEKNPVLHQIVGMVEGVALTMFGYYYGSSKGSRDKTKLLNDK
jgi:hypothetical protein